MQAKKGTGFLLIFFFCLGLCITVGEEISERRKRESKKPESLIRKELLYRKRKELKPPRRNIFSPQSSAVQEGNLGIIGASQDPQQTENMTEALSPSTNLRYIGYVDTGQKIVALIIFEGQAVAVEEGERISEQVTVGKITTTEIEVIGPGEEKRNFPLEGEEG